MYYKMMTAKEAVEELFNRRKPQVLDFTFDDLDLDPDCEPSGWYGMKMTTIFDEADYVFAIGYYGGGSTEAYDIFGLCDNSYDMDDVKRFCVNKLQKFMDIWCESATCRKICVEIKTEQND